MRERTSEASSIRNPNQTDGWGCAASAGGDWAVLPAGAGVAWSPLSAKSVLGQSSQQSIAKHSAAGWSFRHWGVELEVALANGSSFRCRFTDLSGQRGKRLLRPRIRCRRDGWCLTPDERVFVTRVSKPTCWVARAGQPVRPFSRRTLKRRFRTPSCLRALHLGAIR